jgi:hypothetical protein
MCTQSSHVGISGNEVADQAAKEALNEEIDNQESFPPQDLMIWMKKKELMNRQRRWEGGENDIKHRLASVIWQNDTVELSRKEQVVISHRYIIAKTDIPECPFCDVSAVKHVTKTQYGRRVQKMKRKCKRFFIFKENNGMYLYDNDGTGC